LLALAALFIEEPQRAMRDRSGASSKGAWGKLLGIDVYRDAVIGYAAQTFALGGFAAWAPQYLFRELHMDLKTADFWFGLILVVTGLFATFLGAYLGDRFPGEDRARANLRLCAISLLVSVPFSIACLLANSPVGFFLAIAAAEFAIFLSTSPINVVILRGVPEELRASAMALSIFAIHLFGDLVSPPLIGKISDSSSLRSAMFVLPVALAIGTVAWWRGSARRPAPATT
jgi:MFS family permease